MCASFNDSFDLSAWWGYQGSWRDQAALFKDGGLARFGIAFDVFLGFWTRFYEFGGCLWVSFFCGFFWQEIVSCFEVFPCFNFCWLFLFEFFFDYSTKDDFSKITFFLFLQNSIFFYVTICVFEQFQTGMTNVMVIAEQLHPFVFNKVAIRHQIFWIDLILKFSLLVCFIFCPEKRVRFWRRDFKYEIIWNGFSFFFLIILRWSFFHLECSCLWNVKNISKLFMFHLF